MLLFRIALLRVLVPAQVFSEETLELVLLLLVLHVKLLKEPTDGVITFVAAPFYIRESRSVVLNGRHGSCVLLPPMGKRLSNRENDKQQSRHSRE